MSSARIKVFVSSGLVELAGERQIVKSALDELLLDAFVFELDAGARAETIEQTSFDEIGRADLYIGIFSNRYSVYTAKEYEFARTLGKSCLIYEKRSASREDRDPQLQELLDQINAVSSGITTTWFRSPDELRTLVLHDVSIWQANIVRRELRSQLVAKELLSQDRQTGSRLQAFLCHSSIDKPAVRNLYHRLRTDGFEPWLDEENLLPGQDWQKEIPKAVRKSDVVLVCLSKGAVNRRGYLNKEIKYALDVADEQPEGTIFLVPLKLEECDVPEQLLRWQWVNIFDDRGYDRLLLALNVRATELEQHQGSL